MVRVAGCRVLGIVDKLVTGLLWRLIEGDEEYLSLNTEVEIVRGVRSYVLTLRTTRAREKDCPSLSLSDFKLKNIGREQLSTFTECAVNLHPHLRELLASDAAAAGPPSQLQTAHNELNDVVFRRNMQLVAVRHMNDLFAYNEQPGNDDLRLAAYRQFVLWRLQSQQDRHTQLCCLGDPRPVPVSRWGVHRFQGGTLHLGWNNFKMSWWLLVFSNIKV